jgi:tripartite-type tricarboxylate transporter receptor subunit TctC
MTKITRRTALMLGAAAGLMPLGLPIAQAAGYPEKPVRTIIPIAPGGQTDVVTRLLQQTIDKHKLLPQPLVIVNNAAAGGSAGTRLVRDADADGYTIGFFHMGLLTAPAMGVVDYDHTAFELIGQVGRTQIGMGVPEASRFKTIKDVLAEAKAKPDTITVAMNIGLLPHFVPLMFQQDAGVTFRYVQAGGGAVRLKSLLGGHTEMSLFSGPEFLLYKEQGIRPLVMFSDARAPELPAVPTAKESGVNTVFEERIIAFAPKGTAKDKLEILGKALKAAMDDPEVTERFKGLGIDRVFIDGPKLKELLDSLKGPIMKVGAVVKAAQAEQKK